MIVMKFGGSSLKDAQRIRHIAALIQKNLHKHPIVVVSAMGSTTNLLLDAGQLALEGAVDISSIIDSHLEAAKDLGIETTHLTKLFEELHDLILGIRLLKELSSKTQDQLLSFGERLSILVLAAYLNQVKVSSKPILAFDAGIITTSDFTEADILKESEPLIVNAFSSLKQDYCYTPIVTGFIGKDKKGNPTTLGRGGSDLTAAIIGSCLKVEEIQVWKDVNGILTTDPRIVPSATPVPIVSFEEASELAYFGAKVLHPRAILPAMGKNIPVRVKNSYNPDHPGTVIIRNVEKQDSLITAITHKSDVTLVDIVSTRMLGQHGFLASVFIVFNSLKISVDVIATSEVSISLTIDKSEKITHLNKELEKIAHVNIQTNKALISLIGNVERSTESLKMAFELFYKKKIDIEMISHGASKVNISFIIEQTHLEKTIRDLHQLFFN